MPLWTVEEKNSPFTRHPWYKKMGRLTKAHWKAICSAIGILGLSSTGLFLLLEKPKTLKASLSARDSPKTQAEAMSKNAFELDPKLPAINALFGQGATAFNRSISNCFGEFQQGNKPFIYAGVAYAGNADSFCFRSQKTATEEVRIVYGRSTGQNINDSTTGPLKLRMTKKGNQEIEIIATVGTTFDVTGDLLEINWTEHKHKLKEGQRHYFEMRFKLTGQELSASEIKVIPNRVSMGFKAASESTLQKNDQLPPDARPLFDGVLAAVKHIVSVPFD